MPNRQLLVTGAAGGLGQSLVPALVGVGYDVVLIHRQAVDHVSLRAALPADAAAIPITVTGR